MEENSDSKTLINLDKLIVKSEEYIDVLTSGISGKEVPADTVENFRGYSAQLNLFKRNLSNNSNIELILKHASAVAAYLKAISSSLDKGLENLSPSNRELIKQIRILADEIKSKVGERKICISPFLKRTLIS